MLLGRLVRLRAVEHADYPLLARWLNDPDVMVFWGRPGNTEAVHEVARGEDAASVRSTSRKYIIETHEFEAIGQIDYYDLDWQARSAWTSIMIGNRNYWSGGYGTDAMAVLLRFLFEQMALHRVSLNVHRSNERAQRSYNKNGFVVEGTLREWAFFDGKWVDGILMSVLADEFPYGSLTST